MPRNQPDVTLSVPLVFVKGKFVPVLDGVVLESRAGKILASTTPDGKAGGEKKEDRQRAEAVHKAVKKALEGLELDEVAEALR